MSLNTDNELKTLKPIEDLSPKLKKGHSSRGNLLTIVLAVLAFSVIAGGIWLFQHNQATKVTNTSENKIFYYNMKSIVVNLQSANNENRFLKLNLTLVLSKESDLQVVKEMAPSIRDACYVFLRQVRFSDISSSIGTQILKEALMKRINKVIYPIRITDLLFDEMLLQ